MAGREDIIMKKWKIVSDADDEETGEPTEWALEINSEKYGKYIWIDKTDDDKYTIAVDDGTIEMKELKTCKSLTSAKRWVSINVK